MTAVARRFALDQNFPTPLLTALRPFIREVTLVPVRDLDARLASMDDWELLLALYHWKPRIDGLVTSDAAMTSQAREMSVIAQTKLTLVVAEEAGHDPLKAAGLLLLHLPRIAAETRPHQAQIWMLRSINRPPEKPRIFLERIARREGKSVDDLMETHALNPVEIARNPLSNS